MRRSRPEADFGEDRRPGATGSRPARDPDRPGDPDLTEGPTADPAGFDAAYCKRRALDLLARREHSRLELERKLGARGFAADAIAPVLDDLEHSGALAGDRFAEEAVAAALDDLERSGVLAAARFTESFIRARVAKGQGPRRIRFELADRGVPGDEAARLLRDSGVDWTAEARSVRTKRFGESAPHDIKERARQARFLEYRGFEAAHVRAAFGDAEE